MLEINDKVIQIDKPELGVGVILGITHDPEVLYSIDFPFLRCTRREYQLKPYKEMNEERNITLTLEKAKEWYKKGGELKEIALQAFTEKELNPLPRSWEEFCRKHKSVCLSTRYANISLKYDALFKLEQLRDCWRQGWKPKFGDCCYTIKIGPKGLSVYSYCTVDFLSFPTKEMAEAFLECFRDLIELAEDLI